MPQQTYENATVWRSIKNYQPGTRMICSVCGETIEPGQDIMTIWFKGSMSRDYHVHCTRQLTLMLSNLLLE